MKRTALITGGSSGIGEFVAKRLAKEGLNICITGRDHEKLNRVKSEVEKFGGTCLIKIADVSSSDDANAVVDDMIQEFGAIDILIANAGTGAFKLLDEMSDDDFDSQMNTNVRGVFVYLRPVLRHMKERNSGQIVVTSSNLGFYVTAKGSIYCASKFAVQGMVGSVREELKGMKVKIGTVNPGSVDTPWFADFDTKNSKEHRLDVEEVVDAMMLVINQGERSNIDHILLNPSNNI